ncbi:MAG: SDR family NAD(P)-dependent oxidoreductase [Brachybacterium sp.]|uniref:SDR family NAD(P)-dependent oxidoreductase n=1 Tax=unclassified Brachybacterium TaxID=2623841 RepID=UPI003F932DA8
MTRAFLPGMLEREHGTIASAAGLAGVARQTDYSASKWAAVGFTESLRAELRADSSAVGTFVMCPFDIDTDMFEGASTKFPRLLPILT